MFPHKLTYNEKEIKYTLDMSIFGIKAKSI